jgi:DNA polymerase-3 subunit alpha
VPLFLDYSSLSKRRRRSIVQYSKEAIEENGLLRFDVFPSRALSLIGACLKLIAKREAPPDLGAISLSDQPTLDLLRSGGFSGIPCLENPWVGSLLRKFPEASFSDLIILCGLHPPLSQASGLAEEYLLIRRGNLQPAGLHPALDPILAESSGLMLFREQVVSAAERTTGSKTSEAEMLVRSLAHADPEELGMIQPGFLARAMHSGFDAGDALNVWVKLCSAAPVSVSKAHAVSLALVAWRTAYLKARWPAEFMDALLRSEEISREKQESALKEWRSTHLRLIPPKAGNP